MFKVQKAVGLETLEGEAEQIMAMVDAVSC